MLPKFSSILVSLTEVCHVGCKHCGFIGSARDREPDPHALTAWIDQISDYGVPAVIFTGGEPFERRQVLKAGVRRAVQRQLRTGVFTSSYWASSYSTATDVLDEVGPITTLYLSTDVFHQQRVPYSNVHNVIRAASHAGVAEIVLCITYANSDELSEVKQQYAEYTGLVRFHEDRVIPTPYLSLGVLRNQGPLRTLVPSMFKSTCWLKTPLINPNGDLFTCHIGKAGAHRDLQETPYFLGNLFDQTFVEIMRTAANSLRYQYLRTHGPAGVAEMATTDQRLLAHTDRNEYTSDCDMCFSILSSEHGNEALTTYVSRQRIVDSINIKLTLTLAEEPVAAGERLDP